MRQSTFALTGAIVGAMALMGCNGSSGSGGGDSGDGTLAPAFPDGTGQQAHGAKAYPAGPYGVGKGSIIANYKFLGYANAVNSTAALQGIEIKCGPMSVIKMDPSGVQISGLMTKVEGTVQTQVKGLITQVTADVMLKAGGAITMIG